MVRHMGREEGLCGVGPAGKEMMRRVVREEGLRGVGLEETIRRVGREGGSAGWACVRRERFSVTLSRCAR